MKALATEEFHRQSVQRPAEAQVFFALLCRRQFQALGTGKGPVVKNNRPPLHGIFDWGWLSLGCLDPGIGGGDEQERGCRRRGGCGQVFGRQRL